MRPSELNPLFDDSEPTEEQIKRARRLIAKLELKEQVRLYRSLKQLGGEQWALDDTQKKIVALVLELFPEE